METIYHYADYRKYLKDYYEDRKKSKRRCFSYRSFCRKSGIRSPALFLEVVQGKRNLTEKTLKGFVKGLALKKDESDYFSTLVHYNQTNEPAMKLSFLEEIRGRRKSIHKKVVPIDQYVYYSKWYNPVIREQACLLNWKENYRLLARSLTPPISPDEARESVKLLLHLGLLKVKPNGRYTQSDPIITTGSEVASLSVRELNRQMASHGEKAINLFPPNKRDISSLTVGISKKAYQVMKEEILEFKERIIKIAAGDSKSDMVYNLNVQLFPMATAIKDKEISL